MSVNINGDNNTCPALNCHSQLKHDVVFTESAVRSCINDYDDPEDKNALVASRRVYFIENPSCDRDSSGSPDTPPIKTIVSVDWYA